MPIKLNHFNINVTDMEKSIEYYNKYLGLNVCREKKHPDNKYHIVFLTDNQNNNTFLELTWIKEKEGKYNLGDNEMHIAFTTDNYQELYKKHKNANIVIYENKEMGIYFIVDPDGYWIEILPEKR